MKTTEELIKELEQMLECVCMCVIDKAGNDWSLIRTWQPMNNLVTVCEFGNTKRKKKFSIAMPHNWRNDFKRIVDAQVEQALKEVENTDDNRLY